MAKSAFDITFDHVKDENGKNLHVSNIRELERAEKKYDFHAQVLHANQSNYDAPLKRLEQPTVNALYKRKFGRG